MATSDDLPTCPHGHTVCVEARWPRPQSYDDLISNRPGEEVACWGLHVIGFMHDGWKAMVTDTVVVEDCYVRLTAMLAGLGVDLSTVTFSGRGLEPVDA